MPRYSDAELANARAVNAAAVAQQSALRDWFIYGTDLLDLGAVNAATPVSIAVQADADFICTYITAWIEDTGAYTLQITDQGSQRKLSNVPIRIESMSGNGGLPYVLPMPHRFPRNGAILLDFVNLGVANKHTKLALHGYKLFQTAARL